MDIIDDQRIFKVYLNRCFDGITRQSKKITKKRIF